MHFGNICNFRNPEKHVREKIDVTKELGEASIKWVSSIIKNYV